MITFLCIVLAIIAVSVVATIIQVLMDVIYSLICEKIGWAGENEMRDLLLDIFDGDSPLNSREGRARVKRRVKYRAMTDQERAEAWYAHSVEYWRLPPRGSFQEPWGLRVCGDCGETRGYCECQHTG